MNERRGPGARWASFERWLGEREPAWPQAAFRAAVGAATLVAIGGVGEMYRVVWVGPEYGGYDVPQAGWLVGLLGGPTPGVVRGLMGAALAAGAALVVGLATRPAALAAVLCCEALFDLDRTSGGGHDALLTNALWLVFLGGGGAVGSVDAWLRRRRGAAGDGLAAAWPRRLAVVQLGLLYFTAGVHKLGAEWMPWGGFSALYYTLQTPHLLRAPPGALVARLYPLTQLATAGTLIFEIGAPLWLLAHALGLTRRDPRRWLVAAGLALHAGIWVTMDLGPFSLIAMAYYPCLIAPRRG